MVASLIPEFLPIARIRQYSMFHNSRNSPLVTLIGGPIPDQLRA